MWPFDRWIARDVLRVGCSTVEHWCADGGNLLLEGRHALAADAPPDPGELGAALAALFAKPPSRPVTLVMESAWLPVLLLDNGARALRATEVDALARHRFRRHHDTPGDPVATWNLRIDYRAGERWSLAYGLPSRVLTAVTTAACDCGVILASVSPALDWAVQRQPRRGGGGAWYVLVEADRCIVMRTESGRPAGLHAAMPPGHGPDRMLANLDAEQARLGIAPGDDPVRIAHWALADLDGSDPRLSWSDLAGTTAAAPRTRPHALAAVAKT